MSNEYRKLPPVLIGHAPATHSLAVIDGVRKPNGTYRDVRRRS